MPPSPIPTLTTERLVLRPFTEDDVDALAPLQAEESFWWYPLRRGMTKEETAGFLERVITRYDEDGFGLEAVIERSTGDLIGWAGLAVPHFLPEVLPAVEVGWRLAPSARGQGWPPRPARRPCGTASPTAGSPGSSASTSPRTCPRAR